MAKRGKGRSKPKPSRIFEGFAEYWHLIRGLSEEQKQIIAECLPSTEKLTLKESFQEGGWVYLFMRNACDYTLDRIKEQSGIDLIEMRTKILSGKPQLIKKEFWESVKSNFDKVPQEHLLYIFAGIKEEEYDADYMKLIAHPHI